METVKEILEFYKSQYPFTEKESFFGDICDEILQAHEETIKTYADIIQKLGYEHKAEKDKKDKVIKELEIISNNRGKELDNHIVENIKLKKELDKKDKEIELMNEQCDGAIRKILQQQLYKEDFDEYCQYVNGRREDTYIIKDKSLYKKLPSKDVK